MSEQDCGIKKETLSAYLDGELPREEKERTEEHMENCSLCQQTYEELRSVRTAVQTLSEEAPEGFLFGVRKEIGSQQSSTSATESESRTAEQGSSPAEGNKEEEQVESSGNTISMFAKIGAVAAGIMLAVLITGILGPSDRAGDSVEGEGGATVAKNSDKLPEDSTRGKKHSRKGKDWTRRLKEEELEKTEKEIKKLSRENEELSKKAASEPEQKKRIVESKKSLGKSNQKFAKKSNDSSSEHGKNLSQKARREADRDRARRPAQQQQKKLSRNSETNRELTATRMKGQTCMLTLEHRRKKVQSGLLNSLRHLNIKNLEVSASGRTRTIDLSRKNSLQKIGKVLPGGSSASSTAEKEKNQNKAAQRKKEPVSGVVELTLSISLEEAKLLLGSLVYQGFKTAVYPPLKLSRSGQANLWSHMNEFRITSDFTLSQNPKEFLGKEYDAENWMSKNRNNNRTSKVRELLQKLNEGLLYSRQKIELMNSIAARSEKSDKSSGKEKPQSSPGTTSELNHVLSNETVRKFIKTIPKYQVEKRQLIMPGKDASTREVVSAWIQNLYHVDLLKLKKEVTRQKKEIAAETQEKKAGGGGAKHGGDRGREGNNLLTIIYLNIY